MRATGLATVLFLGGFAWTQNLASCILPTTIPKPRIVRPDCVHQASATHFVLSLTWSPEFCANAIGADADTRFQCKENHFGFVVHGLWAESKGARDKCEQPRNCSVSLVSDSLLKTHLCTMPGVQLIQGEWQKHGTCSGLSQRQWFAAIDSVWNDLSLPDPRKMSGAGGTISVKDLRDSVAIRNSRIGISSGSVMVSARDGKLEELRICYDRSFRPMPCPQGTGLASGRVRVAR